MQRDPKVKENAKKENQKENAPRKGAAGRHRRRNGEGGRGSCRRGRRSEIIYYAKISQNAMPQFMWICLRNVCQSYVQLNRVLAVSTGSHGGALAQCVYIARPEINYSLSLAYSRKNTTTGRCSGDQGWGSHVSLPRVACASSRAASRV